MPVKHRTSVKTHAIIHFEKEVGQNKKSVRSIAVNLTLFHFVSSSLK